MLQGWESPFDISASGHGWLPRAKVKQHFASGRRDVASSALLDDNP
jgi:hypothetical protein